MMGGVIDGVSPALMALVVGILGSNSWLVCIECGDAIYSLTHAVVFFSSSSSMIVRST